MSRRGKIQTEEIGLIGLGLMGGGIATCLLAKGFRVVGYDRDPGQSQRARDHIETALAELVRRKAASRRRLGNWPERFRVAVRIEDMRSCGFFIECVRENLKLKRQLFAALEKVVSPGAVIASNTSSIPISQLQRGRKHPGRFIGMHWGEPAQIMRYLEIIPGKQTAAETIERTRRLATFCGKDPTALRVDIRGFISNRLMYAMMREAFYLLEAGVADLETIDRSFRNDIGWWATLAGPFRWMDLTGVRAYADVMEGLLPQLANTKRVPKTMRDMVRRGHKGIANHKGFYAYTPDTARRWEQAWVDFTYDIARLVNKYEKRLQ